MAAPMQWNLLPCSHTNNFAAVQACFQQICPINFVVRYCFAFPGVGGNAKCTWLVGYVRNDGLAITKADCRRISEFNPPASEASKIMQMNDGVLITGMVTWISKNCTCPPNQDFDFAPTLFQKELRFIKTHSKIITGTSLLTKFDVYGSMTEEMLPIFSLILADIPKKCELNLEEEYSCLSYKSGRTMALMLKEINGNYEENFLKQIPKNSQVFNGEISFLFSQIQM